MSRKIHHKKIEFKTLNKEVITHDEIKELLIVFVAERILADYIWDDKYPWTNVIERDNNTDEITELEHLRSEIDDKIKELHVAEQERKDSIDINIDGLLSGDYDTIHNNNPELVKYIKENPLKSVYSDVAIILCPPLDVNLFNETLHRQYSERPNHVIPKTKPPVYDYHLNNCTDMKHIFELLDRIYNERAKPFKLSYSCGYIIEECKSILLQQIVINITINCQY